MLHLSRSLTRSFAYLLCGVLAGCDTHSPAEYERLYTQARVAAAKQAPAPLWAGLRLGMDSAQVVQHLDSLRRGQALVWTLPSGPLPVTPYPSYRAGHLREFALLVPGNGQPWSPRHEELQAGLNATYGPNYPRGTSTLHQISWFNRGTEIELDAARSPGFSIIYKQAGP